MSPETPTITPPEGTQTQRVPEVRVKDPEAAENPEENSETNAEAPEDAPTSESALELEEANKKRAEKKHNKDTVLNWLVSNMGEDKVDPELLVLFEKALSDQEEGAEDENLAEVAELVSSLPKVFEAFDGRIGELAGQAGYSKEKLTEMRTKIIFGLCDSVMNGHLKAHDVINLCGESIGVVSKQNPSAKVQKMVAEGGYDAILYFDGEEKQIYIFEDALADQFNKKENHLDLRHAINHELSHPIVEQAMEKNSVLNEKAKEIIANAKNLKNCQSRHIRTQLQALENIDSDFAKAYPAGTEQQKEAFREVRENRAATEIITDYTGIFLQSDGSIDGFVNTCLEKTDKEGMTEYFSKDNAERATKTLREFNKTEDQAKKDELIEQFTNDEDKAKFIDLCKIYETFYTEIKHTLQTNKGSFQNTAEREDMEDFFEYGGGFGGYGDYGVPGTAGGQPGEGSGFWKELAAAAGDVVKAMANEVSPTK